MRIPNFWRSVVVEGRKCNLCGEAAYARVRETLEADDPHSGRLPLTGMLCRPHLILLMGREQVETVEATRARDPDEDD